MFETGVCVLSRHSSDLCVVFMGGTVPEPNREDETVLGLLIF